MLRVGALGCSAIARRRTLPALRQVPGVRLTVVASRSAERAKEFAAELDAEFDAEFDVLATSYADLVERDDVDAVYLSLPAGLHDGWAERVLAAGKHLLCEKPLTTSATRTRELAALAAHHRVVLRENMAFVHHPQHATVAGLVADGRIGAVRSFHAAFCIPPLPEGDIRYDPTLGGGALLDAGVYPLRAAQLLLGRRLTIAGAALHGTAGGVDLGGEALFTTADGVLGTCSFGFQHAYGAHYTLWGSRARLTVERPFSPPPTVAPTVRIVEQGRTEDRTEELRLAPADQFVLALTSFADAVRGTSDGTAQAALLAETVRTAELVDAVRACANPRRTG